MLCDIWPTSLSNVTGYRENGRGSIPGRSRGFSLRHEVLTGLWARPPPPPPPHTMGTGTLSSGTKWAEGEAPLQAFLVPKLERVQLFASTPSYIYMRIVYQ
jgi:hypothetical protein